MALDYGATAAPPRPPLRRGGPPRPPQEFWRSGRSRRGSECPHCGQNDGQCIAAPADWRHASPTITDVWCIRGSADDGGWQDPSFGFRVDRGGVWYYALASDGATITPRRPAKQDYPLADAATIDAVLRDVARLFGLSEPHRAMLYGRGYDPRDVGPTARHAFATLPTGAADRAGIATALIGKGYEARDLLGVYGFQQRAGLITFLGNAPGAAGVCLLEFARDAQGRYIGFEYAPDVRTVDDKGKPGPKRYSPARFAKSQHVHVASYAYDGGSELWLTEGTHKANLVADARRTLALGTFGAGNAENAIAAIGALNPDKRRRVVLALDGDQWDGRTEKVVANKLYTLGWRVALARWDSALAKGPDDAVRAGLGFTLQPYTPPDGPRPRQDTRLRHVYAWQHASETPAERSARLHAIGDRIAQMAANHFATGAPSEALVIAAPPGVGKSHAVAALGARSTAYPNGERNIAMIVERHDQVNQVAPLASYQHVLGCKPHNCTEPDLHHILGSKGYNTYVVHSQHYSGACDYVTELRASQQVSSVYQLGHVKTPFPTAKGRDGLVIDEMNLTSWLTHQTFDVRDLQRAMNKPSIMPDSLAGFFLRAFQAVITDAQDAAKVAAKGDDTLLHDATLFTALDARLASAGGLAYVIGALEHDEDATTLRPWTDIDLYDLDAVAIAERRAPIILPTLYLAIAQEWMAHKAAWYAGHKWNGGVSVGQVNAGGDYGINVVAPLAFHSTPPATVILDATAHEDYVHRLFPGPPVKTERMDVEPPAHMRHVAVRTGKRYGKMALCDKAHANRDQARVVAELRYLLHDLDPEGALIASGQVGLITYDGCEAALGEALGIPAHRRLHFWAARGSNALEDCAILLIVGTPTLRPDHLATLARALYASDPTPLDFTYDDKAGKAGDGERYADPRVAQLAAYLANSELTQCAHRNRPLRYDGRTVVSLCAGDIDFLPITETISELPQLASEGVARATQRSAKIDARLASAAEALAQQGAAVNLRTLTAQAGIDIREAARWLRARRDTTSGMILTTQYSSYCKVNIMPEVTDSPGDARDAPLADAEPMATAQTAKAMLPPPLRLRIDEHIAFYTRQGMPEHDAIRQALIDRGGLPPAHSEREGAPMAREVGA